MKLNPILLRPIRSELHEVREDIVRMINLEIPEIPHLTQGLAYAIIGMLGLQNAEVVCMGLCDKGLFYSMVLIDGRFE